MSYDCYNSIVGITQTDCTCKQEDRPANYNTSGSGLYLDALFPITRELDDCDGNAWRAITESYGEAVSSFVADTNSLLQVNNTVKRKEAKNQVIGQVKSINTFSPTHNYGVIVVKCAPIRSGVMKLKNIGCIFSESENDFTISLYNNIDGFIEDITVSSVANRHNPNTQDKELPMFSKYGELEYYFVYQFNPANNPKNNTQDCGCRGWSPSYNENHPQYFDINNNRATAWANYIMVGYDQINSLSELDFYEGSPSVNSMLGLTLEFDFTCKVDEVLCNGSLDFAGNPLAMSMANAIRYKWASVLTTKLSLNTDISRNNIVNDDELEVLKLEWEEKYADHVKHIVAKADVTANDCLKCRNILDMHKQGIFA